MSFDLAVCYTPIAMTAAQATAYHSHINRDWIVIERRQEFDDFMHDLMATYPDLRSPSDPDPSPDDLPMGFLWTVADLLALPKPTQEQIDASLQREPAPDNSPWSSNLAPLGTTLSLGITWSRVEATAPGVFAIARRHGLTVYDPQSATVDVPAHLQGREDPDALAVHLTLRIAGQPPALAATLEMDGRLRRRRLGRQKARGARAGADIARGKTAVPSTNSTIRRVWRRPSYLFR